MLLTQGTIISFAQKDTFISKGTWLAGGNVSLSITDGSDWVRLDLTMASASM